MVKYAQDVLQGTQLLGIDVAAAMGFLKRVLIGDELTEKEKKVLLRTLTDLASVVPIGVLMLLPVSLIIKLSSSTVYYFSSHLHPLINLQIHTSLMCHYFSFIHHASVVFHFSFCCSAIGTGKWNIALGQYSYLEIHDPGVILKVYGYMELVFVSITVGLFLWQSFVDHPFLLSFYLRNPLVNLHIFSKYRTRPSFCMVYIDIVKCQKLLLLVQVKKRDRCLKISKHTRAWLAASAPLTDLQVGQVHFMFIIWLVIGSGMILWLFWLQLIETAPPPQQRYFEIFWVQDYGC